MANGAAEQRGDRLVAAVVAVTDQTARVLDWRLGGDPPARPSSLNPEVAVVPLVVDAGELLVRDDRGRLVDAWVVLLFLSAVADALWILTGRSVSELAKATNSLRTHAAALDAVDRARHIRFHEGVVLPPPSALAAIWQRWTGICEVLELDGGDMRQLFVRQRTAGSPTSVVPVAVGRKIEAVARVVAILQLRVNPQRIALVVRRPADAFGGLTALGMIEADRHDELARSLAATFDYGTTA